MRNISNLSRLKSFSAGTLLLCSAVRAFAPPFATNAPPAHFDPSKPIVGDIFTLSAAGQKLLYKSVRTEERTGDTVRVKCDYRYPEGSLAVRDRFVYEAGHLVSFDEEQLQSSAHGLATIRPDPEHPGQRKIFFDYTPGPGDGKKSTGTETIQGDTLVNDMVGPFIAAHWDSLLRGTPARFRYIVLSRQETVGFRLVKESETTWRGHPVVRLRMEPTSFIIAQLVDPLVFTVEKDAPHRVFEYRGRTTPLARQGAKWKDLDADTVFEWEPLPTVSH